MIKNKRISTWVIITVIFIISAGLIWSDNPFLHLSGREQKLYASLITAVMCLLLLLMDELLIEAWLWLVSRTFLQRLITLTGTKTQQTEHAPDNDFYRDTLKQCRLHLRVNSGLRWRHNVRVILITGSVADVESLIPGLPTQLWQEDGGTLLFWGGDPSENLNNSWFKMLSGFSRRPADAMVYVTSAADRCAASRRDASASLPPAMNIDVVVQGIAARYDALGWHLPLFIWSLHPHTGEQKDRITQPLGCQLPETSNVDALLAELTGRLTSQGIQQVAGNPQHHFLLGLADQLSRSPESVAAMISAFWPPRRPLLLAGLVFSAPSGKVEGGIPHSWIQDNRWDALPASSNELPAHLRPIRPGLQWSRIFAATACALVILWGAGMLVSFAANRSIIGDAVQVTENASDSSQSLKQRLAAMGVLQDTIGQLQYRQEHGTPWYNRLGLSQNEELLSALWPRYREAALPLLRDAAALQLTDALKAYAALPPDSPLRETQSKQAYTQLRLYLMLTHPERMDPRWFSQALMQNWTQRQGLNQAYWQGAGSPLLAFYAENLNAHPEWALKADPELVGQVRGLLVRQVGVTNSESRQYQRVQSEVKHQYADMRLADMTGDTDAGRLFTTDEVVPGMFTRQAWEDGVKPAIEKVARERREEMDWVLSDAPPPAGDASSPEALETRLTSRYFADYSAAWLNFLNSLRLQPTPTLSDAIDQLTLMADVRQSPLVALMNTLNVQGRTGQSGDAIADSLVKSAQNLLSREKRPAIDQNSGPSGPLDATFGPLLALTDSQGSSSMSLRTFLTRVTQVRLRLQQVTNAADPQAMTQTLAQTVFQGKTMDLTDTRDYGSLVAAGLGQEWSGFGQTVFVRPMEQAWQQVLMPAAGSLNAQWQQSVVNEWNSAFGGRYPFKNVSSEVSLPLLAKYLNTDNGRITRFLQSRLSGVLHREGTRWVPDSINAQGLTFNPAFLQALNQLSRISDVVFTSGEAGLHFELRPGTAADVMQTDLIIDSQKLTYMNQQPVWKRFTWPADTEAPGASLSWISTKAGTRQYGDMPGSWGLIRLLDKAQVSANPGISSSWQLTWQAPDGRPLNYILRTEAGEGPLALLKLRNFTLPADIFIISDTPDVPDETFVSEED
ncbi:type VI secretion protein VasK [Pantoea sp. Al-1710]|uniref:Type VI secretion protein VasK n=1 Tax=Candidatus Pantoea communis TaxID=2608354 RepID=A0ABX0RMI2_9GAMM|nr:ImcF-related family protein [Pantoea communis]NIG18274.1 type VI secretion protein VasK [Pantoea communis]